MTTMIEKGAVVLFQGDSLTDAGRNREQPGERSSSGAEPFLFLNHPDYDRWREDLCAKIEVVRRLARTYQAADVPTDGCSPKLAPGRTRPIGLMMASICTRPGMLANAWLEAVHA